MTDKEAPTTPREAIELLMTTLFDEEVWMRDDAASLREDALGHTQIALGELLRELGIEELLKEPILETVREMKSIIFETVDRFCAYPGITDDIILDVLLRVEEKLVLPEVVVDLVRPVPTAREESLAVVERNARILGTALAIIVCLLLLLVR